MRLTTISFVALALLLSGCAKKDAPATADSVASPTTSTPAVAPLSQGEARLAVDGGQIWYKKSGTGTGTPVILLHGGPGFNSYYLKPLEALGDERAVIRYDQGGAGKSGTMTDTTMMPSPTSYASSIHSART